MEGHRVEAPFNRDLEQKLTYQQLLNLNHDLSKENLQLKNIGTTYNIQAIDLDRNLKIYIANSTSNQEKKMHSFTTPSAIIQCFININ